MASVKCNLPRNATAAEKLADVMEQLQEKYRNQKVYELWQIERENRDLKSATLNQWTKTVAGMTLREYLLCNGVLSPIVRFDMKEDDVELKQIKGKRCCALARSGGRDKYREESLRKLGAKIVPPTDAKLDYLFIFRPHDICKEPPDSNTDAYFLLSKKESGESSFSILAGRFFEKLYEYEASLSETAPHQTQQPAQLPDISEFENNMHICEAGKTQCTVNGRLTEIVNTIDYTREGDGYFPNRIPAFIENGTYYEIGELRSYIRELLRVDYSAILIPSNFEELRSADISAARADYERFKHICNLVRYEGVMKLLAYAVPRNEDGSLKKREIMPIAYTQYTPVDFGAYQMHSNDYFCSMLVAENTEDGIHLEIRCKELAERVEEDCINSVELPALSAELIEKVLQLGELIK